MQILLFWLVFLCYLVFGIAALEHAATKQNLQFDWMIKIVCCFGLILLWWLGEIVLDYIIYYWHKLK